LKNIDNSKTSIKRYAKDINMADDDYIAQMNTDQDDGLTNELNNEELGNEEAQEDDSSHSKKTSLAPRGSVSIRSLHESAINGPLSNFVSPDDVPSDHGSGSGSSKATTGGSSNQENESEEEAEEGDDEFSDGSHNDLTKDQLLQKSLNLKKKSEEGGEEENEEEEDNGEG